jgi:hypothetical protein
MSYSPYYGVELAHVATASSSTIKSKESIELVIDEGLIQTECENNNLDAEHTDAIDSFASIRSPTNTSTRSSAKSTQLAQPVSLHHMFQWHSRSEIFITIIGIFFAIGAGFVQVGMGYFFGRSIELFAQDGPDIFDLFLKVDEKLILRIL